MVLWLAGCALDPPGTARTAWIVDTLADDNRVWLSRDPSLLKQKYAKMADDPFDFMRGGLDLYWRDLARTGSGRDRTTLLDSPESLDLLIVGDPHPENFGSLLPGEGPGPTEGAPPLVFEVNDFDAAVFGPYLLDLRRSVLGLEVLLAAAACDAECRAPIVQAELLGYLGQLSAPPLDPLLVEGQDPVFDLLLADVVESGSDRDALRDATVVTEGGGRRFVLDRAARRAGEGLAALTLEEDAQLERLLASYPAPTGFRVLDVARRYGIGVASLPAVRYVVAWDRGDPGEGDDEMLQMREVVDPPAPPGPVRRSAALFDGNDRRSAEAPRILWSRPDADARIAGLADGVMTFKVQTWSSFDASQSHGEIAEAFLDDRLDQDDLAAWAARMGAALAAVHLRSVTADGEPAAAILTDDLRGRESALMVEGSAWAEADLAQLLSDHRRFVGALATFGPLLGADELGP